MGRGSKKEHRKERTRLAIIGKSSNMEESDICTSKRRNQRANDRNSSFLGTPGDRQNTGADDPKLLVAGNEERHSKIYSKL